MVRNLSRHLTGASRTESGNRNLGYLLAFVAGAINAGGFLAVQQYTSHMTGIVSEMADLIALGHYRIALFGLLCLATFVSGAAVTALLVNYARSRQLQSEYAILLLVEASLLMAFGILGTQIAEMQGVFVTVTILLLCFVMGLQNAVITKISGAVIRTTHVTGIATDLGIDLGRWLFRRSARNASFVPTPQRMPMLAILLVSFFVGGLTGAIGFQALGYAATLPLAAALIAAAITPVFDDVKTRKRR
ncbi:MULTISPECIES: YoaK family protein [unclassified Yoonia]|uniref:YoaK family protein n=1 Tax=unclassified Yoonia TaxID=2629118 RepID=UPI002B0021D2|nr:MULTISPECIES: YoaK family protein [unclassified Yoonia]